MMLGGRRVLQAVMALLLLATSALSQTTPFTLTLTTFETITPAGAPVPVSDSYAIIDGVFNQDSREVTARLLLANFYEPVTGFHLHLGTVGDTSNNLVINFTPRLDDLQSSEGVTLPLAIPTGTIETVVNAVISGGTYFNLHTASFAAGFVRSQFLFGNSLGSAFVNNFQVVPPPTTTPTTTFYAHTVAFVRNDNSVVLRSYLPGAAQPTGLSTAHLYIDSPGAEKSPDTRVCTLDASQLELKICPLSADQAGRFRSNGAFLVFEDDVGTSLMRGHIVVADTFGPSVALAATTSFGMPALGFASLRVHRDSTDKLLVVTYAANFTNAVDSVTIRDGSTVVGPLPPQTYAYHAVPIDSSIGSVISRGRARVLAEFSGSTLSTALGAPPSPGGTKLSGKPGQGVSVVFLFLLVPLFAAVMYACEHMLPALGNMSGVLSPGGSAVVCANRIKSLLIIQSILCVFILFYAWWAAMLAYLSATVIYYGLTVPIARPGDIRIGYYNAGWSALWLIFSFVNYGTGGGWKDKCTGGVDDSWCGWVNFMFFITTLHMFQALASLAAAYFYIKAPVVQEKVALPPLSAFPMDMFKNVKGALMGGEMTAAATTPANADLPPVKVQDMYPVTGTPDAVVVHQHNPVHATATGSDSKESPVPTARSQRVSALGGRGGARAMPPPPVPPARQKLPLGWKEAVAENGDHYYWNESTGETTWDLPQ